MNTAQIEIFCGNQNKKNRDYPRDTDNAEFEYRQNNRKEPDLFIKTVARMCGTIPLPMAELTADPEANQPF
jgi:hypothetical protein